MSYGKRRRVGMRRRVEVNTEVLPAVPTTEQLPLSACGAVEVSDIVTKPITSVSDSHINCAGVKKSDNDDCVICLEDLSKADYTGLLPKCSHVFCFECISHWSKQETSCPLCKVEFTTITKALGAKAAESVKLTNGKKRKAATELRTKSVKVKKTSQADSYRRQTIQSVLEADLFANFMLQQMLGTLFPQRARGPNGRSAGAPVAPDAPADHSPPGLTLPQAMMFFAMINNNNDDDDIFTGNGAHSSGPEHSTSRVFGPMRATNTNTASSPPTHHTHVIFQNLTGSSSSSSTDSGSSSSRRIEMPFQTLPPELRALFGNMSSNNRESSPRRRSSGYGQGTATNPISLLDVLDEESDEVNQLDHEDEDEDFE